MSAVKHTPGSWVAALDHNSRPIVWGPGTWQIADCWHTPDGNGWGNARLIASAPDLFSVAHAVDAVADRMDYEPDSEFGELVNAARAAIAKATGAAP